MAKVFGACLQTGTVLTSSYTGLGTAELAAHQLAWSFERETEVLGHHSGVVMHSATEIDAEAQTRLLEQRENCAGNWLRSKSKGCESRCCKGFTNGHIFSDIVDRLENPEPVRKLLAETLNFKKDGAAVSGCAQSGLDLVREMRSLLEGAKFKEEMECRTHGTAPSLAVPNYTANCALLVGGC